MHIHYTLYCIYIIDRSHRDYVSTQISQKVQVVLWTQRSFQGIAPHEPRSWRANAEVGHLPGAQQVISP